MKLKLIACEVLAREFEAVSRLSDHSIEATFLPRGLHDIGRRAMAAKLAQAISDVNESDYHAILLGYALCSGGIVGLRAQTIPLVVPKAHDCVTLCLGSREKYNDYFFSHPGTFFHSIGWLTDKQDSASSGPNWGKQQCGLTETWEKMVEKYGEEQALYLKDSYARMTHYSKIAYIRTLENPDLENQSRAIAEQLGWNFELIQGEPTLLQKLVQADWDQDFLIVPPGKEIDYSYDYEVVQVKDENGKK